MLLVHPGLPSGDAGTPPVHHGADVSRIVADHDGVVTSGDDADRYSSFEVRLNAVTLQAAGDPGSPSASQGLKNGQFELGRRV
jgi:hypothetical protein